MEKVLAVAIVTTCKDRPFSNEVALEQFSVLATTQRLLLLHLIGREEYKYYLQLLESITCRSRFRQETQMSGQLKQNSCYVDAYIPSFPFGTYQVRR